MDKKMDEDRIYAYWLANIPGVGHKTIHQLYKYAQSARAIYQMHYNELRRIHHIGEKQAIRICESRDVWDLDAQWDKLRESGVNFVSLEQEDYPARLKNIYDPPYGLYYIGSLPPDDMRTAAIVGARACSDYGRDSARQIAKCLGANGIGVISGMARGIDGYAHEGSLAGHGKTYAVLGCGADIVYPPEHWKLYEQILQSGGIISEQPIGMQPQPGFFPLRNRIISALSDIVIIIEAKEKSGSLITADCALEQGKDIYAVPGRMTDPLSQGCNYLIRQGAGILLSPEDLACELRIADVKNKITLEKSQGLVYSCLDLHPKSIDRISEETELEIVELMDILFDLEERGLVQEVWQNQYIAVN